MPLDHYRRANRYNWDSRVPGHWAADGLDAAGFAAHSERISEVVTRDLPRLGDLAGKRLLHLQCHFGMDTLSLARLGADVTGLDFSPAAITAARRLVEMSGTPGRFVESELYEAPTVLDEPGTFDIVYTGVGALGWLPDIAGWAEVVTFFLKPGGLLYVRDGHPMLMTLDLERADDLLVVTLPYFQTPEPMRWVEDISYAGSARLSSPTSYDWNHGLGEIVQALLDAGLTITRMEEHRYLEWKAFDHMVQGDDGTWRLPNGQDRLPLMFTVSAVKG